MAALAIVGAMMSSCSEAIEVAQPANTGKTVMMKTTVSLDENATTRALTDAGVKTFAVGEQIAVIYKNTDGQTVKVESVKLKVEDIDNTNTHNATFSVPLTNPKPGGAVRYIYPASRAAETVATDAAVNASATVNYAALATQDGTFAKASTLDLATFDGTLTESGTLPATVTLANPLTIGKFTIKNSDGDITSDITGLNISDGTNTYTVNRTPAAGPIYVAMQAISDKTVILNASVNTYHCTKSVTGKTLEASKIYDIEVTITTAGVNLSAVTGDYIAYDDEVLTGTLGSNVKISIADGATVTLNNVTINGNGDNQDDDNYQWAGITCEGDATINIEGTNIVKRFFRDYPAIQAGPAGKTLIIGGTGSLTATGGRNGSGIGSSYDSTCGNITINGGTITASSPFDGAGIGTGLSGTCGNITINGGNITASSGSLGSAIGSGNSGKFGNITIYAGITQVRAKCHSDEYWPVWPIGKGYQDKGSGTVTIDNCSVTSKDWDGTGMTQLNFTATNDGNLYTWTLNRYPMSVATATLSSVDIGKVLAADGKIYADAASANTNGGGARAVIAYVGSVSNYFDKFLAIAIEDVDGNAHTWADALTAVGNFASSHGITIGGTPYNTNAIGATYYDQVHFGIGEGFSSAIRTTGVVKGWRMPSVTDWRYIFDGLGRQKAGLTLKAIFASTVYSDNATPTNPASIFSPMFYGDASNASSLRAAINEACGNTALHNYLYWSSSEDEYDSSKVCVYDFSISEFFSGGKTGELYTRAVFAY